MSIILIIAQPLTQVPSQVLRDSVSGGYQASVTARERLDLNLSTTCVELALSMARMFSQEGEQVLRKPRGSYAPYRIRNRTGLPVCIWSDAEGGTVAADGARAEIQNEKSVDWRFDDWKTMREVWHLYFECHLCPHLMAISIFRPLRITVLVYNL